MNAKKPRLEIGEAVDFSAKIHQAEKDRIMEEMGTSVLESPKLDYENRETECSPFNSKTSSQKQHLGDFSNKWH